MAYPTETELLTAAHPPTWIDAAFLRQDPFAFEGKPISFHQVACSFSALLDVERNGVYCIGSGAIGFSINPTKMRDGRLKVFAPESDFDIAIVSGRHFEMAWRELLVATQPHLNEVPAEMQKNIDWQKKRLFDGTILANRLLGAFSFGTQWQSVIDRISGEVSNALDRNVSFECWIYRDYWSLRNYVARGIVECQKLARVQKATDE